MASAATLYTKLKVAKIPKQYRSHDVFMLSPGADRGGRICVVHQVPQFSPAAAFWEVDQLSDLALKQKSLISFRSGFENIRYNYINRARVTVSNILLS